MNNLQYGRSELVFVHLLAPYILGILLMYDIRCLQLLQIMTILCGSFFFVIIHLATFYKQLRLYKNKWIIGLSVYGFSFLYGGLACLLNDASLSTEFYADKKADYLKIVLIDEPQLRNGVLKFKAEVTGCYKGKETVKLKAAGRLILAIKPDSMRPLHLSYGSELIIPYRFSAIPPPANPGEFDYKSWLAAKNICNQVFLKQHEVIELPGNKGNPVITFALSLRSKQVEYYKRTLKSEDAFAMASTLILGQRADLSEDTLSVYSRTGTIHALSVSGMHLGLIYLILHWALLFLDRSKFFRILKVMLVLIAIWFYTLLTGMSPSVLRSAIMLSAFIIAKLLHKTVNGYNILAFAAFCLLLYDPYLIWDVGFQLSFLAVFGLIAAQPLIQSCWQTQHKWLSKIWSALTMSFSAQLATFPLSIYYFHQFPLYFLIGNLFIVIPSALILYLGMVIMIFRLDFLIPAFEWLINFMNSGLNYISRLPFSSLTGIWIDKTELILIGTALLFGTFMLKTQSKRLLIAFAGCLLLLQLKFVYAGWQTMNQKKIIVFKLRKNYAAAYISARKAFVFTNLDTAGKAFKYTIKPALDLYHVQDIIFINSDMDVSYDNLSKFGQ